MQLNAYLFFDGNCAEAMRYYERTLGGKIDLSMTHADDPAATAQVPADSAARIMHARLVFPGGILMASDWMVGRAYPGMSGFALSLAYTTVAEAQKVFDALADGGAVNMPFAETFWVEAFGMLTDRFGTPWMINGGATKV
ncbi:VOC family protein [Pseudolysobacter antarcticus]|uniref:VOC family protein n=1 Tax=Pseudolysobacter antarcticus TaxID=2511995 RepID=A0A411HH59_9GAMM|nr:VOC family protein [Pseudolysobacter antarcticus]QBB69801.1 VOC family protein [Pseudolysobacter antarcticus]